MVNIKTSMNVNNIDMTKESVRSAVATALEEIGMKAESYAKMELEKPKDHGNGDVRPNVITGRLVNSISHAVENEKTVAIGTNVEYAVFVETGTSRGRAYPYLNPAIMDHVSEYKDIIEKHLKSS